MIQELILGFETFVAKRYLRSPRKDRSISVITKIAIGGVAIGVMVLIVALSMMSGMEKDMMGALKGANSDMTVYSYSPEGFTWSSYRSLVTLIEEKIDIKAYAPFTQHQAFIRGKEKPLGTLIKGIDVAREADATPIHFFVRTESFEIKRDNTVMDKELAEFERSEAQRILSQLAPHFETHTDTDGNQRRSKVHGIIVGSQLARNLGVGIDDMVTIVSLETRITPMGEMPRAKRFKVVGFYETGLMGYDEIFSIIDIKIAQKMFRMSGKINGLVISLEKAEKADAFKEKLQREIGLPYFFTSWQDQNKNMFAVFRLEMMALAIILTLIILLASFLIVSSLVMLVIEKSKDIAILKAMGAKDSSIRKIFIFQGTLIGLAGTVIGVVLGLTTCWVIGSFDIIDLPPGVYPANRIPMSVEAWSIGLIALVSLLICFSVTIIPSQKASKLDPVEGLRNE